MAATVPDFFRLVSCRGPVRASFPPAVSVVPAFVGERAHYLDEARFGVEQQLLVMVLRDVSM